MTREGIERRRAFSIIQRQKREARVSWASTLEAISTISKKSDDALVTIKTAARISAEWRRLDYETHEQLLNRIPDSLRQKAKDSSFLSKIIMDAIEEALPGCVVTDLRGRLLVHLALSRREKLSISVSTPSNQGVL